MGAGIVGVRREKLESGRGRECVCASRVHAIMSDNAAIRTFLLVSGGTTKGGESASGISRVSAILGSTGFPDLSTRQWLTEGDAFVTCHK